MAGIINALKEIAIELRNIRKELQLIREELKPTDEKELAEEMKRFKGFTFH